MSLRIVVADDHGVVRDGIAALLSAIDGFELVGTAATGEEAVRAAVELRPDVLVMDIEMPGGNGIDATARLQTLAPEVAVLVLTMFDDDASVFAAIRAGALGYVLKGSESGSMIRAIAAVAAGEAILGPGLARRTLSFLSAPGPDSPFPELSERERAVLDLLAAGRSNHEIAARLSVSVKTVNNHVSSVYAKLRVAGRPEAIVRAREAGMGQADPG